MHRLLTASTSARRSVTFWAASFVLLVCMVLVGLNAWLILKNRAERLAEAQLTANNLTAAVAMHAEGMFESIDSTLYSLTERIESDRMTRKELGSMRGSLTHLVGRESALRGLYVYDEHGNWLLSTMDSSFRFDVTDREFFKVHKEDNARKMHISAPVESRFGNEVIVSLSRRINHPDGRFAGVVMATVSTSEIERHFNSFNIGSEAVIAINHVDGILVVRRPHMDSIGLDVTGTKIFREYLSKRRMGTMVETSPLDNVERQYAFRRMERYPLNILVGISRHNALEAWRKRAWLQGIIVALLTVTVAGAGLWLVLQIMARARTEDALVIARRALEVTNTELQRLAQYDGLTGLANRRHFDQLLEIEAARSARTGQPLSLLLIDVDHFKLYNDYYGHPAGDACLQKVARAIEQSAGRPSDLAARYGGEEFSVLLPDTDEQGGLGVAERIRSVIGGLDLEHVTSDLGHVTISVGVCTMTSPDDAKLLVLAADAALYKAKAEGRNRVACRALQIDAPTPTSNAPV